MNSTREAERIMCRVVNNVDEREREVKEYAGGRD